MWRLFFVIVSLFRCFIDSLTCSHVDSLTQKKERPILNRTLLNLLTCGLI